MDDRDCPLCEAEASVEHVRTEKTINVRGEPIKVAFDLPTCVKCGEGFINPKTDRDPLAEAYRVFRHRHTMLQPEEIKELRKRYGVTQGELSRILGWGAATLSRYENGALQDATHDRALKLLDDPQNLLRLIEAVPDALGEKRRSSLVNTLKRIVKDEHPIERCLEEWFGHDERSFFTGFHPLDMDKFFNCILYFCKGGKLKTVINKLLFYSDFKHFKTYSMSITGAQYVHLHYGPVPKNYEMCLAKLVNEESIEIDEVLYPDVVGQMYTTVEEPLLGIFSDKELITLSTVKEHFKSYGAKGISEFSHGERGYKETSHRQPISYEYAAFLKI